MKILDTSRYFSLIFYFTNFFSLRFSFSSRWCWWLCTAKLVFFLLYMTLRLERYYIVPSRSWSFLSEYSYRAPVSIKLSVVTAALLARRNGMDYGMGHVTAYEVEGRGKPIRGGEEIFIRYFSARPYHQGTCAFSYHQGGASTYWCHRETGSKFVTDIDFHWARQVVARLNHTPSNSEANESYWRKNDFRGTGFNTNVGDGSAYFTSLSEASAGRAREWYIFV